MNDLHQSEPPDEIQNLSEQFPFAFFVAFILSLANDLDKDALPAALVEFDEQQKVTNGPLPPYK
jgi:hypothetical protein